MDFVEEEVFPEKEFTQSNRKRNRSPTNNQWSESFENPTKRSKPMEEYRQSTPDQSINSELLNAINLISKEIHSLKQSQTSPQQQTIRQMLSNDKRGINRWSKEKVVDKTTHGFQCRSKEILKYRQEDADQSLYAKMMNTNENKDVINQLQGMWVCSLILCVSCGKYVFTIIFCMMLSVCLVLFADIAHSMSFIFIIQIFKKKKIKKCDP